MHFTVEAQERIRQHIDSHPRSGLLYALDATAGNGFDTQFLAELVGSNGKVLAIDIQQTAIQVTQAKLGESLAARVHCYCGCHSRLMHKLSELGWNGLDIAMFNLGYLPLGDKSIITQPSTTSIALQSASLAVNPHSILSVLSYPGHAGGSEEHAMVESWITSQKSLFDIEVFRDTNNPRSPVLWLMRSTRDTNAG